MPIRVLDLKQKRQKTQHDRVLSLVDQMQDLQTRIATAKSDLAKASLERQITATDRQIDQLVYELYELTPDEIKIVEEVTA